MEKKRVDWVDCAKGIAILLVLVGHTIYKPLIRGTIFAFHMPVFFMLSAYTFRASNSWKEIGQKIKKSFKSLVIPAITVFFMFRLAMYLIYDYNGFGFKTIICNIKNCIVAVFWSAGYHFYIGDWYIEDFGALWFLIVLFSVKAIFDILNYKLGIKKSGIVCIILTVIGWFLGYKGIWLPFSFDITMTVSIFLWFGYVLKYRNISDKINVKFIVSVVLFLSMLMFSYIISGTYLELAVRKYPLFPFCHIIAVIGSLCLIYFCNIIDGIKDKALAGKIYGWMCNIGRYSMYLYIIHVFDPIWFRFVNNRLGNQWLLTIIRLVVDIMILYTVLAVKKHFYMRNEKGAVKSEE